MFYDTVFEFSSFQLDSSDNINSQILHQYSTISHSKNIKRTHLFNGRYENIYIDKNLIPALDTILEFANHCAKQTLQSDKDLDIGFWFNDMPPGSVTITHTHDDDDELLSGVYYVKVPPQSGDLVLINQQKKKTITAQAGRLVLFRPDCLHEVTENTSNEQRLSIGMNFGIKTV